MVSALNTPPNKRFTIVLSAILFILIAFAITHAGHRKEKTTFLGLTHTLLLTKNLHEKNIQPENPLSLFLFQLILIIAIARITGSLFRKINQPSVVGEILAGILLGPSLLGKIAPNVYHVIFPLKSFQGLYLVSELGLIFFMFIIGMELDLSLFSLKAKTSLTLSYFSIATPFILGMSLAYFLYNPSLVPPNTKFLFFSLFIGISMSVTAFPVLARILQEKNLSNTEMGTIALSCAAIGDVIAWGLLAIIVALIKAGNIISALSTIFLSVIYIIVMFYVVRPVLRRMEAIYNTRESLTKTVIAGIFLFLFSSALVTELIGIHPLFGAFLAGVILPGTHQLKAFITEKLEDISLVIFMPVFFTFTGLRTEIGLLTESWHWGIVLIVTIVAVSGKWLGTALPARMYGLSWKDSHSIGALMNTRGLMELVALNIGYDIGILSPQMFVILVLMAIITTFTTGPALIWIQNIFTNLEHKALNSKKGLTILLAFAKAQTAIRLLHLISIFLDNKKKTNIYCIHITRNDIMNEKSVLKNIHKMFSAIKNEAQKKNQKIKTDYRFTENVAEEISAYGNAIHADLLLTGGSQSLFSRSSLGGKTKSISSRTDCNNAVLIDNDSPFSHFAIFKSGSGDHKAEKFIREKFDSISKPTVILDIESIKKKRKVQSHAIPLAALESVPKDCLIVMEKSLWVNLEMDTISGLIHSFLLVD